MGLPSGASLVDYSKSLKPVPPKAEQAEAVPVFDNATGETRWVAPEEATAAFKSGTVNLPTGHDIAVQMPGGATGKVAPEDVSRALDDGATIISNEAEHREALKAKYGGFTGGLIAGGAGVARGLTGGASDQAAMLLAGPGGEEGMQDALAASKELHPWVSGAGEVGGMVLGAKALPGAGAGALADEGVTGLLSSATRGAIADAAPSLLGRVTSRGLGLAARGAVDNSIFGLQTVLSEDALHKGDPDLTGEKIVAGMGHGALVGAALGGALGAGSELATEGLQALRGAAAPKLQRMAAREAWRDLNSSKAITKQTMARVEGGTEAIGQTALEHGLMDPSLSIAEQAEKAAAAKSATGDAIGDMFRQSGAMAKPVEVLKRLDNVVGEIRGEAGFGNVVSSLEDYGRELRDTLYKDVQNPEMGPNWAAEREAAIANHEVPLGDLWKQRRALDRLVYQEAKTLDPKMRVELLRKFRGQFEDYISQAGEESAKAAGGSFAPEYAALKKEYQHLSIINDTLEEKAARDLTNRRVSLTDSIAHSGGMSAAGALAGAGHPIGAAISMASGAVNKLLREKGPRLAATALSKLGSLESAALHVTNVDVALERAATGFVEREPSQSGVFARIPAEPSQRARASEKDELKVIDMFDSKAARVRAAAEHPALGNAVHEQLGDVHEHAPESAASAQSAALRGQQFLLKMLPIQAPASPFHPDKVQPPSLAEADRWLRYERAVDHPALVLEDFAKGRVSPDSVQAIREVYPRMYADFQDRVLTRLAERQKEPTRQEMLHLTLMFDVPGVPGLTPEAIAARQQTFADQHKGPGGGGRAPSRSNKPLARASALETASARTEKGD